MDKPLYTSDIERAFNNLISILDYESLQNYNNIDELLDIHGRACILVEFKKNSGHWICCYYNTEKNSDIKSVIVFDSYGIYPSNQLNYIPTSFLKISDQKKNTILKLLYNSKYNIYYNQHCYQSKSPKIATCGRYCIIAIKNSHLDEEELYKKFKKLRNKLKVSNDELAVILTKSYVGF